LMFVAAQRDLSIPPWPLFAILGVLDLAIGVGALYVRRARLLTAAIAASQIVLAIWAGHASAPNVALIATIAVAALAIVWFAIDRRFAESAIAGLFAAQFVAIVVAISGGEPPFESLLIASAVIVAALLVLAWITELHAVAVVAAITTALLVSVVPTSTPSQKFIVALVPYALFIAYPLLLGARAKRAIEPYLAAVVASAWFFLVARFAMAEAKLDNVIGVLPIGEAIVMMLVLWRLLRWEAVSERLLSRLALVAGAVLAFVTV